MQITQFVIDLFIVYFGSTLGQLSRCPKDVDTPCLAYQHFAYSRFPHLPHVANCAGTETAALLGCGLLSSYLVLFINFYIQTYQKPVKGKKTATNGNGHANTTGYDCIHRVMRHLMFVSAAGLKKSENDTDCLNVIFRLAQEPLV